MAQQLVNGVTLGLMYALVALGYTLVFGLLRLLNFAHGEVFMLGSVLAFVVIAGFGWPLWLALVIAAGAMGIIGLVLWVTCFLPVKREEDHMAPALSSFAFGLAIAAVVIKYMGIEPRALPYDLGSVSYHFGPIGLSDAHLLIFAASAGLMLGLLYLIRRTRLGRAMRAIAERPHAAALMGVPLYPVVAMTFFVSSALAGAAGALIVLYLGVVSPLIGLTIGLKSFAVMVIGGIGNVVGAVAAGLLIGIAEVLVIEFWRGSFADAVVWAGLALVLLLRPEGILGRRGAL